jgi:tetratricopeptide (TPR) repeat protein
LTALERYADGVPDLDSLLQREPKRADLWHARGMLSWRSGDVDATIADFSKALDLAPASATYWSERGFVRGSAGKLDDGLADFNKAVELAPQSDAYRIQRATILTRLGRFDEALADAEKAIQLNPALASHWESRGWIYAEDLRWNEAHGDFSKAVSLDPKSATAHNGLAVACVRLGRLADSVAAVGPAIEADPENPLYRRNRGASFAQQEHWEQAETDYQKAIELEADVLTWSEFAHLLLRKKDDQGYQTLCRKAIEKFANAPDPAAVTTLVWMCARAPGLEPELKEHAARLEPLMAAQSTPLSQRALAALHVRLGELEKAVSLLTPVTDAGGEVEDHLLLAIALRALKQNEKSGAALARARDLLEAANAKPAQDAKGGLQHTWQKRLERETLLREAEGKAATTE